MDTPAQKSLEIQMQVRHNAEQMKNAFNDLYSWEKDIKEREHKMLERPVEIKKDPNYTDVESPPLVRSQTVDAQALDQQILPNSNANTTSKITRPAPPPPEDLKLPPPSTTSSSSHDTNEQTLKMANALKDKGNQYVKLGQYTEAIYEYTSAIDLHPKNAVFYTNRALCYLKLERYNDSIEDCDRAIKIDKTAVKAYYRRMQANESLGNNMDALKDCTTVLMIDPKNTEAKKSLDRINNRLRKNAMTKNGPSFSPLQENIVDILPFNKPAYKRSTKPLVRVNIAEVSGPKEIKSTENLTISDEDIDKLFNSNCGPFVEVKNKSPNKPKQPLVAKETTNANVTKENKVLPPSAKERVAEVVEKANPPGNIVAEKETKKIVTTPTVLADAPDKKTETQIPKSDIKIDTVLAASVDRPLPPAPKCTAQFYSNWKELSSAQKYLYLKSIELSHLSKILGAGFDSDTLTDVLNTLHDYYVPNKEPAIAATLMEISKNSEVRILSLLLSDNERKVLREILDALKENNGDSSVVDAIAKNFNLL